MITKNPASRPEPPMAAANPQQRIEEDAYIEDLRRPWQRARELLDAGYDWDHVKWCMLADCRAREKFAALLGDEDMAQLARDRFYAVVKEIEGDDFDQAQIDSWIEHIDRQMDEPIEEYPASETEPAPAAAEPGA